MNIIKKGSGQLGKCQIDYVFQVCIPNLHIKPNTHNTDNLAFIISDYEGIMDIIMKTLCILDIHNQHNVHILKNRHKCTRAVPQVNAHNLPNVQKVPNQHIIYLTCSGWHAQPVRSRLCRIRLHHVFTSSPKVLAHCWGPLGRSEQAVFLGPNFW